MNRKEVKEFFYTKSNGEKSHRRVIVLRPPSNLYLGLDVSDMSTVEVENLLDEIEKADAFRDQVFEEMQVSNRWRSFKPEGIEWIKAE
jgi:hypothetical protein